MADLSAVVGCSPLGLYCKLCRTAFEGEQSKKNLRKHIKTKHQEHFGPLPEYTIVLNNARASASTLSVQDFLTGLPGKGMECSVCRFVFRRRLQVNFKNHLGSKLGRACAEQNATAVLIKYRETICGRAYVVERPATIPLFHDDAPLQEQEQIVEQRGQKRKEPSSWFENIIEDGCRPLLNRDEWCTQLDLPDHEAAALMRPYCREDESEEYYANHFAPIMGGSSVNFAAKLQQLISLWSPKVDPASEPDLLHFIKVGFEWFEIYAPGQVKRLPANIRNSLVVFDGHEHAGNTYGSSYTLRDFQKRLREELSSLVAFAWRFPSTAFDGFKATFHQLRQEGTDTQSMVCSGIFPRFLTKLHMETSTPSIIVQFCLSRFFKPPTDDCNDMEMVECQIAGTRCSDVLHLARAGVLGMIQFHPLKNKDNTAWLKYALEYVAEAKGCYFTNTISPMIADCRAMKAKKPTKLTSTILPNGDIRIGTFDFSMAIIRSLIPKVHDRALSEFEWILKGVDWQHLPESKLAVEIERKEKVTNFTWTTSTNTSFASGTIHIKPDLPPLAWNRLASLVETIIHGFGGGAMRQTQCEQLEIQQVRYTHSSGTECYYYSHSNKKFNGPHKRQSTPKLVKHKVPPSLVWIFLLYEAAAAQYFGQLRHSKYVQYAGAIHYGISDTIQQVFELSHKPTALQVRHLWTAISNCISASGSGLLTLAADESMAALSHHTASTHSDCYATAIDGGEANLFRAIHHFMGEITETATETSASENLSNNQRITDRRMLQALESLLGKGATYLSKSQEALLWHSCNNYTSHVHASTSCGGGKSMSWLLRPLALLLDGQDAGMSIVVLPYNFLSESQYYSAEKMYAGVRLRGDIRLALLSRRMVPSHELPDCLQRAELPSILFVSVGALSNLLKYHLGFLEERAKDRRVGQRITHLYLDEVHTIFTDPTFMRTYDNLWMVSAIGCVVTTLSGSIPGPLITVMARILRLCEGEATASDCMKLIEGGDPIGKDFFFDVECTEHDRTALLSHAFQDIKAFREKYPQKSVHVIASTKHVADSLLGLLKSKEFNTTKVTSDSTEAARRNVAKVWSDGQVDVLCATTCSIYGIDAARCGFVLFVGLPYFAVQLIQGINRLRPNHRNFAGARVKVLANRHASEATRECQAREMRNHFVDIGAIRTDEEARSFRHAFGFKALDKLCCKNPTGCRITRLCLLVGYRRESDCGNCDYCRDAAKENMNPVTRQAQASTAAIQQVNAGMQQADRLLSQLEVRCACRRGRWCDGYKNAKRDGYTTDKYCFLTWGHCTNCGASTDHTEKASTKDRTEKACKKKYHTEKTCKKKMTTLSGRACYHCCDLIRDGEQQNHNAGKCRLGKRLRSMMLYYCIQNEQDFHRYLTWIHSSDANFAAGIKRLFEKVPFQKIVERKIRK